MCTHLTYAICMFPGHRLLVIKTLIDAPQALLSTAASTVSLQVSQAMVVGVGPPEGD